MDKHYNALDWINKDGDKMHVLVFPHPQSISAEFFILPMWICLHTDIYLFIYLPMWTLTVNMDCADEFDKLLLTYNTPCALPLHKQTVLCA